jgi:hypothetical protein
MTLQGRVDKTHLGGVIGGHGYVQLSANGLAAASGMYAMVSPAGFSQSLLHSGHRPKSSTV